MGRMATRVRGSPLAGSDAGYHNQAMYRTILVPFDGSALSALAIPAAAALAERAHAAVHLVAVHDPSAYIPFVAGEVAVPVYDAAVEREHRDVMRAALDAHGATVQQAGIACTTTLLEGLVADTLAAHAAAIEADLVVLTTHGRGGFQRARLGSVTTSLLTRLTAPALVLRVGESLDAPTLHDGPVVCALDATPLAETVLPHAQQLAAVLGARLHLVAVSVPHATPMAPFGAESLLADEVALASEEAGRRAYLAERLQTLPTGTTVNARTDMSASAALLDEAAQVDASVVAMATHGRSAIARLLLGSTTDEVVRHASLPVLVVRGGDDPQH